MECGSLRILQQLQYKFYMSTQIYLYGKDSFLAVVYLLPLLLLVTVFLVVELHFELRVTKIWCNGYYEAIAQYGEAWSHDILMKQFMPQSKTNDAEIERRAETKFNLEDEFVIR